MHRTIMLQAAERIGRRHGFQAVTLGLTYPNPFEGKGDHCADLAVAWRHGYERAALPWSSGGALSS